MTTTRISGPVVMPKNGIKPKKLIILLHGLGADGNDLIDMAPHIQQFIPDAVFVAPNAPFKCDMAPMGYQWFSMQSMDADDITAGIREAAPVLENYIEEMIEKFDVNATDTAILGFSQGCMMALFTAPRMTNYHIAGIAGYSGALFGMDTMAEEATNKPEILLVHGSIDPVISPQSLELSEQALKTLGFEVSAHMIQGLPHGINAEALMLGVEFFRSILQDLPPMD